MATASLKDLNQIKDSSNREINCVKTTGNKLLYCKRVAQAYLGNVKRIYTADYRFRITGKSKEDFVVAYYTYDSKVTFIRFKYSNGEWTINEYSADTTTDNFKCYYDSTTGYLYYIIYENYHDTKTADEWKDTSETIKIVNMNANTPSVINTFTINGFISGSMNDGALCGFRIYKYNDVVPFCYVQYIRINLSGNSLSYTAQRDLYCTGYGSAGYVDYVFTVGLDEYVMYNMAYYFWFQSKTSAYESGTVPTPSGSMPYFDVVYCEPSNNTVYVMYNGRYGTTTANNAVECIMHNHDTTGVNCYFDVYDNELPPGCLLDTMLVTKSRLKTRAYYYSPDFPEYFKLTGNDADFAYSLLGVKPMFKPNFYGASGGANDTVLRKVSKKGYTLSSELSDYPGDDIYFKYIDSSNKVWDTDQLITQNGEDIVLPIITDHGIFAIGVKGGLYFCEA